LNTPAANQTPLWPSNETLRVVLDTNVVMAFWHFCDPKLMSLWDWLAARNTVVLTRRECLEELERVLAYRQFEIPPDKQATILAEYRARAECLPDATEAQMQAATALPRCKDRDDQKFIQLAWESGAHLLLTRDKMLLALNRRPIYRDRLNIVKPERLIKALVEAGELQAV